MRIVKSLITTLLLLLSVATTLQAENTPDIPKNRNNSNTLEVKPQSGEKWWGLVVDPDNIALPFEMPFTINTATLGPTLYKANMMLSNRGRYIWSDTPLTVAYDGKKFRITPPEGSTSPTLHKSGRTLREAYLMCCHKNFPPQQLTAPEVLFGGPIYELGGEDALLYTQADVEAFAEMLTRRGAPAGTILLPMGWSSPSGAPIFDLEAFPTPKEMVAKLHSEGWRVMLTVTPYIMAAGRGFQQSRKSGQLMCDTSGHPTVFQTRLGYTACRNLTPQCAKALNTALISLQNNMGIDGFYLDCLDALPLLGDQPDELERFLTTWHSVGEGLGAVVLCTPSTHQLGGAASSVTTSRTASWESLAEGVEIAVEASLLGFQRTCVAADLDFPTDSPESVASHENLILRTAQLAASLPIAIIPYALWSISNHQAVEELLKWRAEVGPYYLSLAKQSATSAEPTLRHLEYQYPRTGFTNARDQFMIGDRYLVAPVVQEGSRRMVRLPKGKWQDDQGRIIKGPRVIDTNVADGKMAIFKVAK